MGGKNHGKHHGTLHYMFDAVMPFLQVRTRLYFLSVVQKFTKENWSSSAKTAALARCTPSRVWKKSNSVRLVSCRGTVNIFVQFCLCTCLSLRASPQPCSSDSFSPGVLPHLLPTGQREQPRGSRQGGQTRERAHREYRRPGVPRSALLMSPLIVVVSNVIQRP